MSYTLYIYDLINFIPVVNKRTTNDAQSQPDAILPPWAIAVAVLGVVSVVIVLLLGASVVMKYKN
jgi:hypothetical protein